MLLSCVVLPAFSLLDCSIIEAKERLFDLLGEEIEWPLEGCMRGRLVGRMTEAWRRGLWNRTAAVIDLFL